MGVLDEVAIPFLRVSWPKEPDLRGYLSKLDATPLFVGEATNRDYAATVHGAYPSGLRAAGQALKGA
ncbi:MAG: FAD-dependent oxidoreductase [Bryobacterales bacterium]|nr:FAD-dependent oxidoreductase [Bryobacterales bacterium]